MSNEEERLWRLAGDAKHGALDVVNRLQNLMNTGAPSISDLAYTIRLREKEDYKIVEKVLRKRRVDPTYDVHRIRDVVGLRVVTLYRLDALEIIPRLIEFIQTGSDKKDSLFVSPEIEEIKIYSTNPTGDAQALPQRLMSLFDYLGYADKAEVEDTPSNYSSIHMVTWCRGRYRQGYQKVPLEIQIRTALEDAWSEIDHKLKYKPGSQKMTVRDESVLQVCLAHLNVMKSFVDGAAQYADQIRVQADQVTARRFVSTTDRVILDTIGIVHKMDLPTHIRTQIENALEQQQEAMHPSRRTREFTEARVGSLRTALRELEISIELVSQHLPGIDGIKDSLLRYYLPLEIALCTYQLGVELKGDKNLLAESVRQYQLVQEDFPEKAIVRYRYGRALAALGDFQAAIKKLEEANDLLTSGKDNSIEPNHWLRLSVPRNIGALLWEFGETLKPEDGKLTDPIKAKLRELTCKAYSVTRAAYDVRVDPDPLCDAFDRETRYRGRLANNLLYYIEDYIELGGNTTDLIVNGYAEGDPIEYVSLLEEHFERIDSPATVETVLRHYCRLRATGEVMDAAKIRCTAERLQKLLLDRGVADSGGKSHEENMLRTARRILTDLGNS